jgi:pseudouridine-5'-phosphate glycosidase/pseudouridine kinase
LESVVRANGGVPATIGVLDGVAKVGLSTEELIELASTAQDKSALKVSRRDLGYICGMVS